MGEPENRPCTLPEQHNTLNPVGRGVGDPVRVVGWEQLPSYLPSHQHLRQVGELWPVQDWVSLARSCKPWESYPHFPSGGPDPPAAQAQTQGYDLASPNIYPIYGLLEHVKEHNLQDLHNTG